MPHVLTRPGGGYLSLYGWTNNKAGAMQFRSKQEAQDHVEREKLVGALVEMVPEAPPPGVDPNGAAAIFGYRKAAPGG